MKIDIEILSSIEDFKSICADWNALVVEEPASLQGQDATSTYEWFETIHSAFLEAVGARVIVARSRGELIGVLPVIASRQEYLGPRLRVATELNGGRNTPPMREPKADVYAALLGGLDQAFPGWTSIQMTMPANNDDAKVVICAGTSNGYAGAFEPNQESPFFPLLESADVFRSGISKSVLQMLRTSRNKFAKIGVLSFREYTDEQDADKLMQLVLRIEEQSWKHEAGSAITAQPRQEAFYRALFPRAMKAKLLHAEVLMLEDEPIAYNVGLIHKRVFACLKHSNVQTYEKLSPVYLVNESLFEKLRLKGVVTFDFMGLAEPHKLRWSEHNGTYRRDTWVFFNRSLKARSIMFLLRQKKNMNRLRAHLSST